MRDLAPVERTLLVEYPDAGVPVLLDGSPVPWGFTGQQGPIPRGHFQLTLDLDPATFGLASDPATTVVEIVVEDDLTVTFVKK